MRFNQDTGECLPINSVSSDGMPAICSNRVLLVPYCPHHVATYHEWMKDPHIQKATASEPLTLEQEYDMQKFWRQDDDKLTFIICQVASSLDLTTNRTSEVTSMLGDVNLFISYHDEEDGQLSLVGELELMVASPADQRRGYGRAALLCFMQYVLDHQSDILQTFILASGQNTNLTEFSYLTVKIGEDNTGSLHLFENLGFVKTTSQPNYFGEYELRRQETSLESLGALMAKYNVEEYQEFEYNKNFS